MSKLNDSSISILEAMENIKAGKYVMPAFQRQYVWSMDKIEKLWDSIMQGYPISTFLFWHIDDNNVSWDTYFCDFMSEIRFDSSKKADNVNYELRTVDTTIASTAILDGQQRLTSLYISLFGETGIRQKHQRRNNSGKICTKLLLELDKNKIDIQDEFNIKKYDIKFTDKVMKMSPTQFEIKHILNDKYKNIETRSNAIEQAIAIIPTDSKDYARNLLNTLCVKVFDEKLIRYTEIFDMQSDDALEMFVRFNNGGVSLKKSEITMSILEAYWPSAKTEFGRLLNGKYWGFDTDFIIRCALMIYGDVIKSNINKQVASDLKNQWQDFKLALKNTADVLESLNIDISRFTNSWNAIIPIVFYVYFNPGDYMKCIDGIRAYLHRAIFFTFFKSGTTSKLQIMKNNIIAYGYEISIDMLNQINELKVTDAKIEELMFYEKGSRIAGEVLYYTNKEWLTKGVRYEQDHLHPYDRFDATQPYGISMIQWAQWRKIRNQLPNLQYLEGRPNASKQNMSLQSYYDDMTNEQQTIFMKNSMIPNVSLDISNFGNFFEERRKLLIEKIKMLVIFE